MTSDDYKVIIRADTWRTLTSNAPQIDEVAIIIADNENESRDKIVQRRRVGRTTRHCRETPSI